MTSTKYTNTSAKFSCLKTSKFHHRFGQMNQIDAFESMDIGPQDEINRGDGKDSKDQSEKHDGS